MQLDLFFYLYGIISIILILMILFIISKSTDFANLAFIVTPLLFTAILIFNMFNYYGSIVNNFLLWFPYLIAPLGMLISSIYILKGQGFHKNQSLLILLSLYIVISVIFSWYPNPLQFGNLSTIQKGSMHLYLIIPFLATIYYFWRLIPEVPEVESSKIYLLLVGLIFASIGSLLRGVEFILYSTDSTLGMVIIVLGSILAMLAFAGVKNPNHEPAKVVQ